MTEITSSDLKCEEIKDCHVGQEDEIIIHQQDAAQVDDPEINQGMQDQQENQEEIVGDDEETPHIQRKSTRERHPPKLPDGMILYQALLTAEMMHEYPEEPDTVEEALSSYNKKHWEEAMNEDQVWELVDPPQNRRIIKSNNILETFSFTQLLGTPTRVSNTSLTLIDLIITNLDINDCTASVEECDISDPFLIKCIIKLKKRTNQTHPKIFVRPSNQNILETFEHDLINLPWFDFFETNDIDVEILILNKDILAVFDLHAPVSHIVSSELNYTPWITGNIEPMQSLRDKALKKFKNSHSPYRWDYYKQLRNITNSALRAYLNPKLQNCNFEEKWIELEKLNIAKNKKFAIPCELQNANFMNEFSINSSYNDAEVDEKMFVYHKNYKKAGFNSNFSFHEVDEKTISEIILSNNITLL
ncbi:hypothetical protein JTB14_032789 [Gonioctena quinquepunctata]|nr:hypothetical protein JTB14_032789 [Gonioctena quinquepunctata]